MPADQEATVEVPRKAIEDIIEGLRDGGGHSAITRLALAAHLEALLPPPPDPWEGLGKAMYYSWRHATGDPYDAQLDALRAALDWLREHPEAGLPGGLVWTGPSFPGHGLFRLDPKDWDGDR